LREHPKHRHNILEVLPKQRRLKEGKKITSQSGAAPWRLVYYHHILNVFGLCVLPLLQFYRNVPEKPAEASGTKLNPETNKTDQQSPSSMRDDNLQRIYL
jgi:hypothetical protein